MAEHMEDNGRERSARSNEPKKKSDKSAASLYSLRFMRSRGGELL